MFQVSGYGDTLNSSFFKSTVSNCKEATDEESAITGFRALVNMLHSLTNNDGDGRMIVSKGKIGCSGQAGYIKYVMLTGQKIFSEVCIIFLVCDACFVVLRLLSSDDSNLSLIISLDS